MVVKKGQALQPEHDPGSDAPPRQQEGEPTEGGWGTLDGDLLSLIGWHLQCDYISKRENIGAARLVNRLWAAELPHGCSFLRVAGRGPAGWEHRFSGLEKMIWLNPEHDRQCWGQNCPNLEELVLSFGDDEVMRTLRSLPGLIYLKLKQNKKITEEGYNELQHLPALAKLNVEGCQEIPHAILKDLTNLSALDSLQLSCCGMCSEVHPELLKHRSLNVRWCGRVSHMPMKELRHMSTFTSVNLVSCSRYATNASLAELSQLSGLTSLRLSNCRNITDEGLKLVRHNSALTSLELDGCEMISHIGVKQLGNLPALTSLNLSRCPRIKDEALKELKRFSALTNLNLCSCHEITYEGLRELKHMTALVCLNAIHFSKIPKGSHDMGWWAAIFITYDTLMGQFMRWRP